LLYIEIEKNEKRENFYNYFALIYSSKLNGYGLSRIANRPMNYDSLAPFKGGL
jgi:hypothetical protein